MGTFYSSTPAGIATPSWLRRVTKRSTYSAIRDPITAFASGLLDKEIHIWGVDMISTDHPMNLPIGRFLGGGGLEQWKKVRKQCEEKFGGSDAVDELFPGRGLPAYAQRAVPTRLHACGKHGVDRVGAPELQNRRLTVGVFPWLFKGGEAAFCRAVAFLEE